MPGRRAASSAALAVGGDRLHRREQRDLDLRAVELGAPQRREARVTERGGLGVADDGVAQAALRHDVADATAKLTTLLERDEAGAGRVEPGLGRGGRQRRTAERGLDGGACETQQGLAARGRSRCRVRRSCGLPGECEGCVADDPAAVAGGVAGVAQVEHARGEAAVAGGLQEAADGVRAAGLLGLERLVEVEDLAGGGGVEGWASP
jgi:hypothetical protein